MKKLSALMPNNCAVRQYVDSVSVGRCWRPVGREGICPVHGDVSGVQFRFCQTGQLTNDFDLRSKARAPSPPFPSDQWIERFRRAHPRAELVAFRTNALLVKLKKADRDFPHIVQVTGGSPEAPVFEEM